MNLKYLVFLGCLTLIISCNNRKTIVEKETPILNPSMSDVLEKKSIDTIFYDENWVQTTKGGASYFRPLDLVEEGNLWLVKDYYITGELQYKAYSISKTEEIWEGKAIWYSKDGTIAQQTSYFKGIEITDENLKEIEQKKIYETYDIQEISGEVLIFKETGFILNDTIPDYVFLFDDRYVDRISKKRLVIQLNSDNGSYYHNEFNFNNDDYLDSVFIDNNQLILEFKDERRLTNWQRVLRFKLEVPNSASIEDYDEYFETNFVLQEDIGFAEYPNLGKKVSLKKDTSDFGNETFLGQFNIKDSTDNFTWESLQKTTNYQDYKYSEDDNGSHNLFSFLESIQDNKTIHIKKGVYNFSKILYHNNGSNEKYIEVENGSLYIKGYSNIRFIAEDGVYFVSNNTHSDVVDFTNCKNIEVNNIHALHNVKKTFCEAPVFRLSNSDKLTFTNCIVDGSGEYGFYLSDSSDSLKILNSTITNCSSSALYAYKSSILMDNVKIIKNHFSGSLLDINQSTIEINNCIIENNTVKSNNYFDIRYSKFKMENCSIKANVNYSDYSVLFYVSEKADNVLIKRSKIMINSKNKLFRSNSPKFIECNIIEN